MNAAPALQAAPAPLLSVPARLAAGVAVAALAALAWQFAGQASGEAVRTASAAFHGPVTYVTLPRVDVVARREPAAVAGTVRATNEL